MSTMSFDKEMYNLVSQVRILPSLVNTRRMLELIHAQSTSVTELESFISYDSSLAANLMMTGNKSCYGLRGKVGTLSRILGVLGLGRAKWMCLISLMMSGMGTERVISQARREMLWKRSFVAAKVAVEIARKRPWVNVEEAFLLGLIYDIGWQIMALRFNEQFEAIFETAERKSVPAWWIEVCYGLSHAEIGRYLAVKCAFPEIFKAVAAFHHFPEKSDSFQTEVTLICLVDVLAHSRENPEAVNEEITLSRCRRLCISEDEWSGYQQSLEQIWREADLLWGLLR
jgi:HD-like signal output (HDOD) protein